MPDDVHLGGFHLPAHLGAVSGAVERTRVGGRNVERREKDALPAGPGLVEEGDVAAAAVEGRVAGDGSYGRALVTHRS